MISALIREEPCPCQLSVENRDHGGMRLAGDREIIVRDKRLSNNRKIDENKEILLNASLFPLFFQE